MKLWNQYLYPNSSSNVRKYVSVMIKVSVVSGQQIVAGPDQIFSDTTWLMWYIAVLPPTIIINTILNTLNSLLSYYIFM